MASGATRRLQPQAYVGIAHIAFGALGLITGTLGILFALSGVAGWLLVGYIGMVALAGLTIVAGLWLHDGHRRGAILAAATDGLRLLLALLDPPALARRAHAGWVARRDFLAVVNARAIGQLGRVRARGAPADGLAHDSVFRGRGRRCQARTVAPDAHVAGPGNQLDT